MREQILWIVGEANIVDEKEVEDNDCPLAHQTHLGAAQTQNLYLIIHTLGHVMDS